MLATVAVAVLAFAAVVAGSVLPDLLEDDPPIIAVVTSDLSDTFGQLLEDGSFGTEVEVRFVDDEAEAHQLVLDGKARAAFSAGTLSFREEPSASIEALATQAYRIATLPGVLASLDLTLADAQPLIDPEPLPVTLLDPPDAEGEESSQSDRVVASATVILLLMSMSIYGATILNGVVEEKSSRIAEVLMGALRPWELLLGKVLGILALAVAQIGAGIVSGIVAITIFGTADLPDVGAEVGILAIIYLVLGLLLYSFVFAAAGATASRQEDAQPVAVPITFTLVATYLLSLTVVGGEPNSLFARILSIVPISSPLAMPPRIAVSDPPLWEVALSLALLLITIPIVIRLAGRVYAGAILHIGPRIGLRDAWRSARETG